MYQKALNGRVPSGFAESLTQPRSWIRRRSKEEGETSGANPFKKGGVIAV